MHADKKLAIEAPGRGMAHGKVRMWRHHQGYVEDWWRACILYDASVTWSMDHPAKFASICVQLKNTAHNPLRQHHPLSAQMPRRGGRRDSRDGTMTCFVEYDIKHTQGDNSLDCIFVTCIVFQFSSPAPVKLVQP